MSETDWQERAYKAHGPLLVLETLIACLAERELPETPYANETDARQNLADLAAQQCQAIRKQLWGEARVP